MSRGRTYKGSDVDITFNASRCIHAAQCLHGLPDVFDAEAKPWITPDGAAADEIAAVVARCPTGALSMVRHDDAPAEIGDEQVSVAIVTDGPLHVRGKLTVGVAGEDQPIDETRAAFCRCGW